MSKGDLDQGLSASTATADFNSYRPSGYPELETVDLHPVATIRLLDNLFVNAGLEGVSPSLGSISYFSSTPSYEGDGFQGYATLDGGEWAWGNIGLTWNLSKHQHLFMTYRSPVDADSDYIAAEPAQAWAGASASGFGPGIELPTIIGIGYGFELTETFSLETDIGWLDFSRYKAYDANAVSDPVLLSAIGTPVSTPENGRNILASGVGADWKFASHWALRARYDFFESPEHNSAFSPTTPDVNQHVITLGVAWKGKNSSLEVAYAMDFYYDQHIANDQQPSFNGTYGFSGHLLSLAYKFTF